VTPVLEAVLGAALHAYDLSDGLVNAAVAAALIAAGYDRTITKVRTAPGPISEAAAVVPLHDVLEVGTGWAHLRAGHTIDLGGVGKGWLSDALSSRFDNGVVNLGGDLRARGDGPGGSGWEVTFCDGASYRVIDAGVATSGVAGRRWSGGHHLIDPRTGRPATTDIAAVSVSAADALQAEVLAKAAAILGSAAAPGWLHDHEAMSWGLVIESES
jgi:thiamine biosynthesis lipoprotein